MTQTTVTTDPLINNGSTISGLLSQLDNSLGGNFSSDNLFSNLLSQDSGSEASSLPVIPPATAQASTQNTLTTSSDASSSTFLQNLTNLSSQLNKLIQLVRQQKSNTETSSNAMPQAAAASTHGGGQISSQSTSYFKQASPSATTDTSSTGSTSTTPTDSATANASTDTKKTIADILSELLLLTQMVMKDLQQVQKTAAGTGTTSTPSSDSEAASTTAASGSSSASDSLLQLIAALEKTVQSLQPALNNGGQTAAATTPATTAAASNDASSALISTEQNTIFNFVDNVLAVLKEDLNAKTTSAQTPSSNKTKDVSEIVDQLAAIDTGLKSVLGVLQSQKQTPILTPSSTNASKLTASVEQDVAVPVPAVAPETNLPLPSTTVSAPPKTLSAETNAKQGAVAASTTQTPASSPSTTAQTQTFVASEAYVASGQQNTSNGGFNADLNDGPRDQNVAATNTLDTNITAEGAQAAGTYNFASTLSALRALNGGTTGLPSVVDQVILQMNRNVKNGNDQMSIQLQPGDLGKITVKLSFSGDGKVQGTVTADNPQTLGMLQKDSRSLERALQDAGLRTDPGSLQFNLGGQTGNNAGQTAHNGANKTTENGTNSADGSLDESGLVDLSVAAETYYITPTGVNIQV